MVTLVFLGKLADLAGTAQQNLPAPLDWAGLIAALPAPLAEALQGQRTRVALNGELLADKTMLSAKADDEVALLPPVSGG